jgi:hypothetical protein
VFEGIIPLSSYPVDFFWPSDVTQGGGVGSDLQSVYIAGCYIGAMRDDWEKVLAPAKVIMYNRLSYVSEHVFWLLFNGPRAVMELK